MSDTPRTDAEVVRGGEFLPTPVQFPCRQLECELAAVTKENESLKQHAYEIENRLRALWDKLEYERGYYMKRINKLEEAGDALANNHNPFTFIDWIKVKEAKS
jgi:hypothetical protein